MPRNSEILRTLVNQAACLDRIAALALDGLCTNDSHHKQWYLEQIAEEAGLDVNGRIAAGEWEPGIAP